MSYIIPASVAILENQPFPINSPNSTDGWDHIETIIYPKWYEASGEIEWADLRWVTADFIGTPGFIQDLIDMIPAKFYELQAGGDPLAWRLFKREIFDVTIPDHMCAPNFVPIFGGDCVSIPVIGGTTLVTAYEWSLQLVYQGSPAAIALTGSLTLILVILGIIAVVLLQSSGKIHLEAPLNAVGDSLQKIVEAVGKAAADVAGGISQTLILWMGVLGLFTVVFPRLQTDTHFQAGPIGGSVGASGRATAAEPRRR